MTSRLRIFLLAASLSAMEPWLDVPYVRQQKAGCGAAAVAMVMQYWARQDSSLKSAGDTSRLDELLPSSRRGIRGGVLKDYLKGKGFDAYVFDGEMQDLRQHFAKGRPLIVCLGLSGPDAPFHYAVVVGVDREAVWLHDSARGKLVRESLDRFEKSWAVTGRWALLAVPHKAQ